MTTLWSIQAFAVIPFGALCLVLLLSDFRRLQRLALSLCSVHISLGSVTLSLSSIFALFASIIFVFQSVSTLSPNKPTISATPSTTVEMVDRMKMKEWRNDRNWWIALFACTIWLIVWRLQIWTRKYCLHVVCDDQVQTEGGQYRPHTKSPADKKSE